MFSTCWLLYFLRVCSHTCCSDMLPTSCNHYCTREKKGGGKRTWFQSVFLPNSFWLYLETKAKLYWGTSFLSHSSQLSRDMRSNNMAWDRLAKPSHLSYLLWLWSIPRCCHVLFHCTDTPGPNDTVSINLETPHYSSNISPETKVWYGGLVEQITVIKILWHFTPTVTVNLWGSCVP